MFIFVTCLFVFLFNLLYTLPFFQRQGRFDEQARKPSKLRQSIEDRDDILFISQTSSQINIISAKEKVLLT